MVIDLNWQWNCKNWGWWFSGHRLTLQMVARLQNFPDAWILAGGETAQYRQMDNALPPAIAFHVGQSIAHALNQIPINTPSDQQLELEVLAADVD